MARDQKPPREVYFEHVSFGHLVKVSAVDAASGTEVSISGPANAGQKRLEEVALQKLMYVMSRK